MENQEVLRSKPLSYEASKAVLKSLRLETRESINRRIPALRTINSRLPYILENVIIGDNTFKTNGREWIMRPIWVQSSENPLREVVDPENRNTKDYDYFIGFIDLDVLENVKIIDYVNSMMDLCDKPEIKTCKNLTFYSFYLLETNISVDQLLRLRNQHLQLEIYRLTLHDLQLLVQDWITAGRDIGTRFSWEPRSFDGVVDHLNRLKTHFGAVEAGSNLDYYFSNKKIHGNVITLKMGEDRELVMYCGESKMTDYLWTFEMEVVASTTATGTVPTSDV
ncbi:hypothetical protein CRE_17472 [Caenorhabditis remanei]|uniref:F-box associated domain-containing protein n=1 Tax=Caenorhabditis remanei TaxID=31234 RepID=E3N279_CAERE|nr:hypothetical protein CRE_17472 [Caenorhabditis remanei]